MPTRTALAILVPSLALALGVVHTGCSGGESTVLSDGQSADGASGGLGTPGSSGTGPGSSGASGGGGSSGASTSGGSDPAVTAGDVVVTDIALGSNVITNEDEAGLLPIVLSALPSGASKIAFQGNDGAVHVKTLDAAGVPTGAEVSIPAHDFSDFYATESGGVLLLTRAAQGGGTLNCGNPANLCGTAPSPAVPCFDMYLVGFTDAGETWATKVTSSSADLPPYSTSKTGPTSFMVWWYAHHGRIASDGTRFAGYFGDAISVSEGGCINIHQGDRMKIVGADGAPSGGGFDLGCSHSGYERIVWDPRKSDFVTVCQTDNANRIAFAPSYGTIKPVNLRYASFGDFVLDGEAGGYWGVVSDRREGQPSEGDGMADVHLLHFGEGVTPADLVVTNGLAENERAPHLARYGVSNLLAIWDSSPALGTLRGDDGARRTFVQARALADGAAIGQPLELPLHGSRYQAPVTYPDGSVGILGNGAAGGVVKLVRIAAP